MKKVINLLVCLAIVMATHAQTQASAKLDCDSTTYKKDTVYSLYTVYVDSTTGNLEKSKGAYAVMTTCRLTYFGVNGAPNAPTDRQGMKDIYYWIPEKKYKIGDKWIVKFINK